ncbi:AAA family ATPase [Saccharothrix sp. S26]|uniref:BTAD domain-containing putative transcriptional regulator n=1 Tax=Saccharothrix sp. S26 TaxID=2907215 RepID=UPI001F25D778|nr:BTAD domain-containing putative transcriptional regulator [Saccharothrix sp. S26]MCE6999017.1 AAA family ATPase [Saccharothrix sp. S26]
MTYFKILGPLEVVRGDELVDLGGTRQRAALGLLLLNRNRVVASSQMVDSLWPRDKVPLSARKIVQNSVWRLRRALSTNGSDSAVLLSQPPGYMLRVGPGQTDVQDFHHKVEAGRAKFAEGDLAAASELLRQALELWRGPALADLVESGIHWPELTPVQNARLDALEDYFEVELCRGHHQQILADLQRTVATEPLRERLCGQLMLALYRSGRQTDALNAYYTVRTTLVEKVGLEPSPALRSLQQAILTHDPGLIPAGMQQQIDLRMTGLPREQADEQPKPAPVPPSPPAQRRPHPGPEPDGREDAGIVATPPAPTAPSVQQLRSIVAERRNVSALIVRCQGMGNTALEEATAAIRDEVESLGGTLAASIGSIWLALFGVPGTADDDAERAVLAALTIRDRLGLPDISCDEPPIAVHVAVATGEVLVRYHPDNDSAPSVSGVLLDECHGLLSQTPVGEIRVCENTRRATERAFTYLQAESSFGWQVGGLRQEYLALQDMPVVDREHDLEVLRGLLHRTRHLDAPHLVTVLGEPGVGKTRFVLEFERRVAAAVEPVRVLVGRARRFVEDTVTDVLNDLLCSYCGVDPQGPAESVRAELVGAVERLVQSEDERRRLLTCLGGLPDQEREPQEVSVAEVLRAWRHLLGQIALCGPVIVVVEDLHVADDHLVDFVEELPRSLPGLPVLVVVTARPDLLTRRPMWGSRLRHAMMMNLEPISDTAIDRLLEFLRSTRDSGVRGPAGSLLAERSEDSDARRRHVRRVLASGSSFLRRERHAGGDACDQATAARVVYCEITEMPAPASGVGR